MASSLGGAFNALAAYSVVGEAPRGAPPGPHVAHPKIRMTRFSNRQVRSRGPSGVPWRRRVKAGSEKHPEPAGRDGQDTYCFPQRRDYTRRLRRGDRHSEQHRQDGGTHRTSSTRRSPWASCPPSAAVSPSVKRRNQLAPLCSPVGFPHVQRDARERTVDTSSALGVRRHRQGQKLLLLKRSRTV